MGEPVFTRLAALAERRKELEELSATPAELRRLSRKELEELRHLARPPQIVRECLEVVYVCLHVEEVGQELQRLQGAGRVAVPWKAVQAMLARFEAFFPAMQHYDIAPLVASPAVAEYLARRYFGEGGLTQDRVQRCSAACAGLFRWCSSSLSRVRAAARAAAARCSAACAGLFRWCSSSLSRVRAAMQLLQLDAELAELQQAPARWRCQTDEGWRDYPGHVHEQLAEAEELGVEAGEVRFELEGQRYEVDLAARVQRNVSTGFVRAIRPPGTSLDLRALQGTWRLSWGGLATVCGRDVRMDGEQAGEELQQLPCGSLSWRYLGGDWRATGGPLHVVWCLQGGTEEEMPWEPAAKQPQKPVPPLPAKLKQLAEELPPAPETARSVSELASPLASARSVYRVEGSGERWVCKLERGWAEYCAEVDGRLREAQDRGGPVEFELEGERYEVNLTTRTQRNLASGFLRPVRPPPGEIMDIFALQGLWDVRSSGVVKARVRGVVVYLDGQESQARLESKDMGIVQWRFGPKLLRATGSPLKVVWTHGGDKHMAWTPTARA